MFVTYSSNNSGGSWWLSDEQWFALEKAGWKVHWHSLSNVYGKNGEWVLDDDGTPKLSPISEVKGSRPVFTQKDKDGNYRFLGALANYAYRSGLGMREAAEEWERITGSDATAAGCPCCGQPHRFTEYDSTGRYVKSGPTVSYDADWD